MYSGITSGRVLNGELLYTKILEVNLFAFAYRLFHRGFSPIKGTYWHIGILAICPIDWGEITYYYQKDTEIHRSPSLQHLQQ